MLTLDVNGAIRTDPFLSSVKTKSQRWRSVEINPKGITTPSVSVSVKLDPIEIHCDAWKWWVRFPSVTMYFNGIQFDAAADAGCVLGLRLETSVMQP